MKSKRGQTKPSNHEIMTLVLSLITFCLLFLVCMDVFIIKEKLGYLKNSIDLIESLEYSNWEYIVRYCK